MIFTYAPKGQAPQTFKINDIVEDLAGHECEAIEEAGGTQWDTFGGWFDLFSREGYRAAKVLAWVLLQRANPDLGLEELAGFKMTDFTANVGSDEVEEGKDESGEAATEPAAADMSSASPTPVSEA